MPRREPAPGITSSAALDFLILSVCVKPPLDANEWETNRSAGRELGLYAHGAGRPVDHVVAQVAVTRS